jgi:hypothetical protein
LLQKIQDEKKKSSKNNQNNSTNNQLPPQNSNSYVGDNSNMSQMHQTVQNNISYQQQQQQQQQQHQVNQQQTPGFNMPNYYAQQQQNMVPQTLIKNQPPQVPQQYPAYMTQQNSQQPVNNAQANYIHAQQYQQQQQPGKHFLNNGEQIYNPAIQNPSQPPNAQMMSSQYQQSPRYSHDMRMQTNGLVGGILQSGQQAQQYNPGYNPQMPSAQQQINGMFVFWSFFSYFGHCFSMIFRSIASAGAIPTSEFTTAHTSPVASLSEPTVSPTATTPTTKPNLKQSASNRTGSIEFTSFNTTAHASVCPAGCNTTAAFTASAVGANSAYPATTAVQRATATHYTKIQQ